MKMTDAHRQELKTLIEDRLRERGETIFEVQQSYRDQGHTDTRFRWDLLWMLPNKVRTPWFDYNRIYNYCNDDHIDTALKAIVREMTTVHVPDHWDGDLGGVKGQVTSFRNGQVTITLKDGSAIDGPLEDLDGYGPPEAEPAPTGMKM